MKINHLEAHDFKIFKDIELNLNGKSTVIFGVNGTGKSTVLSMINYLFRVWINRINPAQGKAYESLSDDIIKIGSSACEITAQIEMNGKIFALSRHYQKQKSLVKKKQATYDKKQYEEFCSAFEDSFLMNSPNNMPIFVNYGTNRAVLDIPLRIRNKHEFSVISALDRVIENELDFRTFFEWFRNQEDIENEVKLESNDTAYQDILLKCVRRAVESMIGNVSDLRVKRNPLCMKVKKGNQEIKVDQLSDGEKCVIALFGDLARRIAIANQDMDNPLEGEGVVLIDEIELHMHPSWQRKVLAVLADVFPNIQFIITTHSPQVLGEADDRYTIVGLDMQEGDGVCRVIERMDGFDSNYILEEYMNTASKNEGIRAFVKKINLLIFRKEYEEAEEKIKQLKQISGDTNADVILLEGYLRRVRGI